MEDEARRVAHVISDSLPAVGAAALLTAGSFLQFIELFKLLNLIILLGILPNPRSSADQHLAFDNHAALAWRELHGHLVEVLGDRVFRRGDGQQAWRLGLRAVELLAKLFRRSESSRGTHAAKCRCQVKIFVRAAHIIHRTYILDVVQHVVVFSADDKLTRLLNKIFQVGHLLTVLYGLPARFQCLLPRVLRI